ncbi:MAG: LysM peptidoglycan-binding domain-containing protein [Chloroflexi bacterium]|nr:LysM peptidoglycan-binding domain-containing protein [Chloroflexota bacterium]
MAACGGEVVTVQPTTNAPLVSTSTAPVAFAPTLRPTATAPLLPPAATATPTVTPTPIVHVVQEGDTLGAIAFQYGVSVEAVQSANGIENPQFLRIAQELVIPTSDDETESIPGLLLPTSTPLPLVVRGVAFYETPVGSLLCLGEVANTTDSPVMNVQVYVGLFDAAGERLVDTNVFVDADVIPPGERSPFGVLFTSPPSNWANFQVTLMRGEASGALGNSYVPVAVIEKQGEFSTPQFQAVGTIQNIDTEKTADSVSVTVTTYDSTGLVTGFRQEEVEGVLAPGATAPFTVLLNFYGAVPADFSIIALGRVSSE